MLSMTLFLTGTVFSFASTDKSSAPKVSGTSVIMIDSLSGKVLYNKNASERRDPASITKILTCLVVLENLKLDQKVTVMENSSKVGCNINMKKGEVLTVRQLLYALMLPSANDAARVLAIATGGDIDSFCDMMNAKAKECGATRTHFTNPNGLNLAGQENHKTTAEDLAKITSVALQNKTFRKLVTTKRYTIPATNKSKERKLKTTDALLISKKKIEVDGKKIPLKYENATGVKTGTTSVAGNCFVGSAKKGNTELIVVTLNSGDKTRFTDAIQLFDYGFANYKTRIVAKKYSEQDKLKVKRGKTGSVAVGPSKTLAVTLNKGKDGKVIKKNLDVKVNMSDSITAPVKKDQVVGTVNVVNGKGKLIKKTDAVALASVGEGGILSHIGIPDDMVPLFIAAVITLLLVALVAFFLYRERQKRLARKAKYAKKTEEENIGE